MLPDRVSGALPIALRGPVKKNNLSLVCCLQDAINTFPSHTVQIYNLLVEKQDKTH